MLSFWIQLKKLQPHTGRISPQICVLMSTYKHINQERLFVTPYCLNNSIWERKERNETCLWVAKKVQNSSVSGRVLTTFKGNFFEKVMLLFSVSDGHL